MRYEILNYILWLAILINLTGCSEDMPLKSDGNTNLTLLVNWNSTEGLLPLSNAKVIISSEYGMTIDYTNEKGTLVIRDLPSGYYNISVRKPLPTDSSITIVGSLLNFKLISGEKQSEIIIAEPVSNFGISINEIYCSGPVNSIRYVFDQFIELYNSSDSIKYLDGVMVLRVSGNNDGGKGPGADEDDDNDLDGVIYAFRFPGQPGGKEYPLLAKSFIVLASDAANHQETVSTSLDLSDAEWEFYNQFSGNDFDTPAAPNLRNMLSEETSDFLINLNNDVILISTGTDSLWNDGIDISSIIDGVEYQSSGNSRKTLDERIDKSYTTSPPSYSGKSMQRRQPGVDTNNSMLDWEILTSPTPGYQ